MEETHSDVHAGHLGVTKTIARVATLYYWPGMFRDVGKFVRSCDTCLRFKSSSQLIAGKMYGTPTEHPWEVVSSDFMGPFPRSTQCNTMVLVFHDKFTKWTEIIPIRTATAEAVLKHFRERIIALVGPPRMFHSDNGPQYDSRVDKAFMKERGIIHRYTAPYSPQANPTERVNRVIKTMISQYIDKNQKWWDRNIPELMYAINTSQHESTGFSPFSLNFGRAAILPN